MKKLNIILVFAFSLSAISCEKALMKPTGETGAKAIFDEYSKIVKEKYAMLEFKQVDIDQLIDSISPLVNDMNTEKELFDHLATITNKLRDGHSSLIGSSEDTSLIATFDLFDGYPIGADYRIIINHYIHASVAPNISVIPPSVSINFPDAPIDPDAEPVKAVYGKLPQDSDLGYILIPSFAVEISDEELETIFTAIKDTDGLILDVRLNGGGSPELATKVASYFMNTPTYTGFERFKTGPAVNDFSDSPSTVNPAQSSNRYFNPVVVLTDRGVYSATTTLCYNMDPLSNVTFMGQRTGGGSGSVADGFLTNGWKWSLSTSEFIDHKGRHLDDGFDPDVAIALDTINMEIDEVIEAAIQYLN